VSIGAADTFVERAEAARAGGAGLSMFR